MSRPPALASHCLGRVHPHGRGWVRQLRCLNRVIRRIVRGPHAQIYRQMRQEHIPGTLSGT
jgi:hypothetical protein